MSVANSPKLDSADRKAGNPRGAGITLLSTCEICGKHRSVGNHAKCSKMKQKLFGKQRNGDKT